MKYRRLLLSGFACGACITASVADSQLQPYAGSPGWAETKEQRLAWFRDAKFGMFIHWGLYAPAGGYWPPNANTGRKYKQHYAEWIRNSAKVPEPEYGNLTKPLFQPEENCTRQWAEVAAAAGMKYAVLTTKHHDGYTLFNANAPYSVNNDVTGYTNISPEGRDLVHEFSQSMRGKGIRVGYYYSLIDWQHPDAVPQARRWPLGPNPDHTRYVKYLHSHILQLFSEYGKVDILWADYSSKRFQGKSWETRRLLDQLRKLQPQVIINNRFWNGLHNDKGDFFTPEKSVPATGYPERVFEVCHTMNESFGFSHHDTAWKSTEDVIHLLVDIVSKGGTLLLNVGPDANGRIPQESVDSLRGTGRWLKTHGDAIYGTGASPFPQLPDGVRATQKALNDGNTMLYLHLLDWPQTGAVQLPGLMNTILSAKAINGRNELEVTSNDRGPVLHLPPEPGNEFCTVFEIKIVGSANVDGTKVSKQAGDS